MGDSTAGDVGLGLATNSLELGCDCLGTVRFSKSVKAYRYAYLQEGSGMLRILKYLRKRHTYHAFISKFYWVLSKRLRGALKEQ